MKKVILATRNRHKLVELGEILSGYEFLSLDDIGFEGEIDENGNTTEANAQIKALAVSEFCTKNNIDYPVVADDTGLFVEALGGEPGVYSARYAGNHDSEANRQKLIANLKGQTNRKAYFQTTICCVYHGETLFFDGKTFGEITDRKIGDESFGYDCVFFSDDLKKTFGQATEEEKNAVSHRGRATSKLKAWLEENY